MSEKERVIWNDVVKETERNVEIKCELGVIMMAEDSEREQDLPARP